MFEDTNGDGLQDGDELGIANLTVVGVDSLNKTQMLTTDGNGDYSANVPGGVASTDIDEETLPVGAEQSFGEDPTTLVVPPGGVASDLDGFWFVGTLEGYVFEDTNKDEMKDANETGFRYVTVVITDRLELTTTVTTDSNGLYSAKVLAGNATTDIVESTLPLGFERVSGVDPSSLDVPENGTVAEFDGFLAGTTGLLQGLVFEDLDGDGVQDDGEPGLEGMNVFITESLGATQTVTTNSNGTYSVVLLEVGNATIDIVKATFPFGFERVLGFGDGPTTVEVVAGTTAKNIDGFTLTSNCCKLKQTCGIGRTGTLPNRTLKTNRWGRLRLVLVDVINQVRAESEESADVYSNNTTVLE